MPSKSLRVRRTAAELPAGQSYIDIIDADPELLPGDKGVRYSVYTDTDGFMEIEAAGGCPVSFQSGSVMSVEILTEYFNA